VHFPSFQHLSSPASILPFFNEKAPLSLDFFDRLKNSAWLRAMRSFLDLRTKFELVTPFLPKENLCFQKSDNIGILRTEIGLPVEDPVKKY
jgi:hypothetical protein